MTQTIRARYHAGKLEPLEPLELEEGKEVTLTLTEAPAAASVSEPFTATAGAWAGNVPDDFEELVYADRLGSVRARSSSR
jgi:predicted DNA-binding antitoxin AbrB/MazE fold protein